MMDQDAPETEAVEGYDLCAAVSTKECSADAGEAPVCIKYTVTMDISGSFAPDATQPEVKSSYTWAGAKLHGRDCVSPQGATCEYIIEKAKKTSPSIDDQGNPMTYTYPNCELFLCDDAGENCVLQKDEDTEDEDDTEDEEKGCPRCGEVIYSSATLFLGGVEVEQTPAIERDWKIVEGFDLCSDGGAREECSAEDPVCAKYQITMSITGKIKDDTGNDVDYRWEGAKLQIRECLGRSYTCDDILEEIKNKEYSEEGTTFTYSDCKLEKCDVGEDCEKCKFPDAILGGYKAYEGEFEGERYGMYMCFPPFVMTPNRHAFMGYMEQTGKTAQEAYMDIAYTAGCHEDKPYLPECRQPHEAHHCGIPPLIEHGHAVEFMMREDMEKKEDKDGEDDDDKDGEEDEDDGDEGEEDEDDGDEKDDYEKDDYEGYEHMDEEEKKFLGMMPMGARYVCDEDYMMHQTTKEEWGWCRKDGSFSIPHCEHKDDYYKLEFRLHHGREKKLVDKETGETFGGLVQVREIKGDHTGEWKYGCNDGFNDNAAGAICRSLGFKHGAGMPVSKKMQSGSYGEFGWTHFHCNHDDTLPVSLDCEGTRYDDAMEEMGMKAMCFDFDRIAVRCFNHKMLNVDVKLIESTRSLTCAVKVAKKGMAMHVGQFENVSVVWRLDDEETELNHKYNKRKGYTVRAKELNKMNFQCITCEIYMGDTMLAMDEMCKED